MSWSRVGSEEMILDLWFKGTVLNVCRMKVWKDKNKKWVKSYDQLRSCQYGCQAILTTLTAILVTLDTWIGDELTWPLQGTWFPRDWSKASFRYDWSLGSIPWDSVASGNPDEVTLDSQIQGHYALSTFLNSSPQAAFQYVSITMSCVFRKVWTYKEIYKQYWGSWVVL